jgi:hypothetical protein
MGVLARRVRSTSSTQSEDLPSRFLLAKPGAKGPERLDHDGAFASMVAPRDGSALIAWESNGNIVTRTVE